MILIKGIGIKLWTHILDGNCFMLTTFRCLTKLLNATSSSPEILNVLSLVWGIVLFPNITKTLLCDMS